MKKEGDSWYNEKMVAPDKTKILPVRDPIAVQTLSKGPMEDIAGIVFSTRDAVGSTGLIDAGSHADPALSALARNDAMGGGGVRDELRGLLQPTRAEISAIHPDIGDAPVDFSV